MVDISDIPGILRRNMLWLLIGPLLTIPLALGFLAFKTPSYRAAVEILIEPQGGVQLLANGPGSGLAGADFQSVELESQAYIFVSTQVLNQVAEKLGLDNDPALHQPRLLKRLLGSAAPSTLSDTQLRAKTIANLRERIRVERQGRSFVFLVVVDHPDAVMSATIANEIAQSYLSYTVESRSDVITRASSSLGRQATALKQRVEEAENAVEAYKSEKGLISTGTAGLVVDQQIQALNTQIAQAQGELERAKSTFDLVAPLTLADVEAGGLPQTTETSTLNSLRVQYARVAQQEAQAATTLGASHPTLREFRSQLADTQRQINSELQRIKRTIKSQYEQAQGTLAALQAQSRALQSENSEQGKDLVELRQLQLEAESSRSVYEAFLRRAKELEEQPELDTNESRILSEAQVPSKASGPSSLIVLLAAALFGVAVPAGLSVAMTVLRGRVTSERDLVKRTGLPIVSLVPNMRPVGIPILGTLVHKLTGAERRSETQKGLALSRVAYALRHDFEDHDSANILVLSIDDDARQSESVARAIATQLFEMGEDVLLAQTATKITTKTLEPEKRRSRSNQRKDRIGNLSRLAGSGDDRHRSESRSRSLEPTGALARYLKVEQFNSRRKYGGGPDLAADEFFLIVDAGSARNSPFLPVLLRHCDGVLLVSTIGETNVGDLDRTLAYLQPWQDRVIGNVVLEAA